MAEEPEVVLAEVLIYLTPFFVDEDKLGRLGRSTDNVAREAGALYFPVPVRVEVDLAEGSVSARIKASGLLVGIAIFHSRSEDREAPALRSDRARG